MAICKEQLNYGTRGCQGRTSEPEGGEYRYLLSGIRPLSQ